MKEPNWDRLSNIELRQSWEETIDEKYLTIFVAKYEETVPLLHKRWSSKEDESGALVGELREGVDISTFAKERRRTEMPQIWSYRTSVTLAEVQRHLPQAMR